MVVIGIVGWKNSGKTRLMQEMVKYFSSKNLVVGTIKHAHHNFDIDRPGKDSYEHRKAGATEVMISSINRWALMHELGDEKDPPLKELMDHMSPVDLLIVEGFKWEPHLKIEIHRPSLGKPLLQTDDKNIIAVASDEPLDSLDVPVIPLGDICSIADFIVDSVNLKSS